MCDTVSMRAKKTIYLCKPTSLFLTEEIKLYKENNNPITTAVVKIVNVKNFRVLLAETEIESDIFGAADKTQGGAAD